MNSLFLNSVHLVNFKNYENEKFNFCRGFNIITGQNGMGKTNVLDTIYYLSMLKSNFARSEKQLRLKGKSFLRLESQWSINDQNFEMILAVDDQRKIQTVNGKDIPSRTDHIGRFPIVIICPEDENIIREGSLIRRKTFDHILSLISKEYLMALIQYSRLLKQRNAYLKSNGPSRSEKEILLTYSQQMQEPARIISSTRTRITKNIEQIFNKVYHEIGIEKEICTIDYQSTCTNQNLLDIHKLELEKDLITSRTNTGIHKDDWIFKLNDERVKYFGSQGQQKTFVLSVKLSLAIIYIQSTGTIPLLLLDDVFDKLDANRVKKLLIWLEESDFQQLFLTDTSTSRLWQILSQKPKKPIKLFEIEEGNILYEKER
jgi:DNA replication and repair protein RecF